MLELVRKKAVKTCTIYTIVGVVAAILCLVFSKFAIFSYIKGPVALTPDMSYEEMAGKYVTYDVEFVIGEYVRNISKNTKTGSETLTNIGYLIYDYDRDNFFCLKMGKTQESKMDTMIEDSWKWLTGESAEGPESFTIKGTLEALPSDEQSYFRDTVSEYLSEDYVDDAHAYVIDTDKVDGIDTVWMWMAFVGAIGGVLFAIASVVRILASNFDKNLKKYLSEKPGVSMETIEADFDRAQPIGASVRIGNRWTFDLNSPDIKLVEHESIVWAYYFQRTGKNAQSLIRLYDINGKLRTVDIPKKLSELFLNKYVTEQPHMVVGYQKELEKMYKKDLAGFLNLRYYPSKAEEGFNTAYDESAISE